MFIHGCRAVAAIAYLASSCRQAEEAEACHGTAWCAWDNPRQSCQLIKSDLAGRLSLLLACHGSEAAATLACQALGTTAAHCNTMAQCTWVDVNETQSGSCLPGIVSQAAQAAIQDDTTFNSSIWGACPSAEVLRQAAQLCNGVGANGTECARTPGCWWVGETSIPAQAGFPGSLQEDSSVPHSVSEPSCVLTGDALLRGLLTWGAHNATAEGHVERSDSGTSSANGFAAKLTEVAHACREAISRAACARRSFRADASAFRQYLPDLDRLRRQWEDSPSPSNQTLLPATAGPLNCSMGSGVVAAEELPENVHFEASGLLMHSTNCSCSERSAVCEGEWLRSSQQH